MKLRAKSVIISFFVSLIVFAIAWLAYQKWSVEQPLEFWLQEQSGANVQTMKVRYREVNLTVTLGVHQDLADFHQELLSRMPSSYRLSLHVLDNPSVEMAEMWETARFVIEEASQRNKYSLIPSEMEKAREKFPFVSAKLRGGYIYISWADDKGSHLKRIVPTELEEGET